MDKPLKTQKFKSAREKLIGLSLESTRKSYYPQLQEQLAELKRAEERYRLLFEHANDAIFIVQGDRIKFPNPKTMQILGLSAQEIENRPFIEFVHPSDREMVLHNNQRRLAGDSTLPETYSFRIIASDKRHYTVEINAVLITWEQRPATLNFVRDVTEKIRLEDHLRQAQKMESIGILAGGVAHDFNNLLQVMSGNLQLLLGNMPPSHPDTSRLQVVARSIDRAGKLVQQLLLFSRKAVVRKELLDFNREVDDALKILERTIPKMIVIQKHLTSNLWLVSADPVQVEQVLLNLGTNAMDAMPGGGTFLVKTRNMVLDPEFSGHYPEAGTGRFVLLTVSDTGCGMTKETLNHVFDPFFTTKEVGRGTGLGLASVYGIVRAHGGFIRCYSEPDQGTTFKIYWPAMDQESIPTGSSPQEDLPTGGHETILLVDDEPEIRNLTREILETFGYRVLTAQNGEQALAVFREQGQDIDLVLLDLNMPGMGGRKCLQELLAANPRVRVLIASGYPENGYGQEALSSGARGFIGKPYQMRELAVKVREALDG